MSGELYAAMMHDSPIQETWKPKIGHITDKGQIWNIFRGRRGPDGEEINDGSIWFETVGTVLHPPCGEINKDKTRWLPRQEELQEMAQTNNKDIGIPMGWFIFALNKGQELKWTFSECYTIAWCLFVHKEIYGLSWDWGEKKWKDPSISEALDHPCATCEHPDCEICQQTGRKSV